MALSPPGANSVTIAVTVPVPPLTTTEYCLSFVRAATLHGSMRMPEPAVRLTVCVVARAPPMKLYQLTVTVVAVTLCSMIGVDHPTVALDVGQKHRPLVRFGR